VARAGDSDFHTFVIVIAAHFTFRHTILLLW
jgi:hypothetical protein